MGGKDQTQLGQVISTEQRDVSGHMGSYSRYKVREEGRRWGIWSDVICLK